MTGIKERYQQAMSKGNSAAWDQDWDKAASYYRQALEDKPNDIKALNSLALALYELRENEEALKFYLKVAEITPDRDASGSNPVKSAWPASSL